MMGNFQERYPKEEGVEYIFMFTFGPDTVPIKRLIEAVDG